MEEEGAAGTEDTGVLDRSNALRAAVFGVQDGIVSNVGLIMGVIGADVAADTVVIAGVAGLASGAVSMGAGEYVSVRTQREMLEAGEGERNDDLPSPWRAMSSSFVSFALGALVPLFPFFLLDGNAAVLTGAILSAVFLAAVGAALTRFTERSLWRSALRILMIGGAAGTIGFGLGNAVRWVLG